MTTSKTPQPKKKPSGTAVSAEISNVLIARELDELGDLVELTGGNVFRARAYHNAARAIGQITKDVAGMALHGDDLTELPGIGESLAEKIHEMAETGTCKALEQMRKKVPEGLPDLLTIPGLGPSRVRALHERLGICTRIQLMDACRHGKLRKIKGMGAKLEEKLLQAAGTAPAGHRFKLGAVQRDADKIIEFVRSIPGVKIAEIAGSYRRSKDTVGDLDIVAEASHTADVVQAFLRFPEIESKIAAGETKASVVLRSGLQVDLRVVPHSSFGAALYYFTGSKAHNIDMRDRAGHQGLLLNEYGLFDGKVRVAGQTEKSIFDALGLQYVPPELRENEGEIEAALKEEIPELIEVADIKGELHSHTLYGDGRHSIEEMARAAMKAGLSYLAITDHSPHATAAGGLTEERLRAQLREIDALNAKLKGIRLLKGIESEIMVDGSLDLPDDILSQLDIVVCAANSFFHLKREEQTERILRAMDNPYCRIIAHPSGRILLQRDPYELDMQAIMRKAADKGVILEVNGHPDRLDLDGSACRMAKDEGVLVSLTSDAHSVVDFAHLSLAVGQARRGWLEAGNVVNTRSLEHVRKLLARR